MIVSNPCLLQCNLYSSAMLCIAKLLIDVIAFHLVLFISRLYISTAEFLVGHCFLVALMLRQITMLRLYAYSLFYSLGCHAEEEGIFFKSIEVQLI